MLKLPFSHKNLSLTQILPVFLLLLLIAAGGIFQPQIKGFFTESSVLKKQLDAETTELRDLKNQDQYKINQQLLEKIGNIHKTYLQASIIFEKIQDYKASSSGNNKYDQLFAQSLKYLSDENFSSAAATLNEADKGLQNEQTKQPTTKSSTNPTSAPQANNTPPQAGYSRQYVMTEAGGFNIDIISADLGSTRVIVDTASSSDCASDCPVLPLADYANRNGAFAAINGAFFCPPEYPSCVGKTNSFDTLLMNKNKTYFNSDNNVYSVVPAVIFSSGSVRFVSRSLEWGRDTGVDSVLANYPLLLSGGNIVYNGSENDKFSARGARCFVGAKGSTIYIGTIYNATMSEGAQVLKALGIQDALNLDEGGSTALWYQGRYLAGPGRNLPDALLFIRK